MNTVIFITYEVLLAVFTLICACAILFHGRARWLPDEALTRLLLIVILCGSFINLFMAFSFAVDDLSVLFYLFAGLASRVSLVAVFVETKESVWKA